MAELQTLGVRSVPVLSRGDKYTFGQSTKQIVDFLGLTEKSGPELSTDELAARVTKFMGAALELIPLMPADRLDTHVPGRPRSYRSLAFHLFRVADAFLDANENVTLVQAMFREEPAPVEHHGVICSCRVGLNLSQDRVEKVVVVNDRIKHIWPRPPIR